MLNKLKLQNFRNFEFKEITFDEHINIILANNASGKTSILEAICVLNRLSSPRTNRFREIVRFKEKKFSALGKLKNTKKIRLDYGNSTKKLFVNSELIKNQKDYLSNSNLIVWAGNEDYIIAKGPASYRRKYLDFVCSQYQKEYLGYLHAYNIALKSRNKLLKKNQISAQEILVYSKFLELYGKKIIETRQEVTFYLKDFISESYKMISSNHENLIIKYLPNIQAESDFIAKFQQIQSEEYRFQKTLIGPHRDDFSLHIDEQNSKKYASEGQIRNTVLALKLAQVKLFTQKLQKNPILLIDDVFGELDKIRRNSFIKNMPKDMQIIISTTSIDWLNSKQYKLIKI